MLCNIAFYYYIIWAEIILNIFVSDSPDQYLGRIGTIFLELRRWYSAIFICFI